MFEPDNAAARAMFILKPLKTSCLKHSWRGGFGPLAGLDPAAPPDSHQRQCFYGIRPQVTRTTY